jgi:protein-tyrosine phosphatase
VSRRTERHLAWEGAFNARDLGGLRTRDGRSTRFGAIVRSDSLATLTAAGWSALLEHGVRTIIDLRNDEEIGSDVAPRPSSLTTIHLPLDGSEEQDFWSEWRSGPQFGSPLYYRPHLERFPERSAAVIAAIARARPGGVAFHCVGGRDCSGQIAILLLALVGVGPEEIVEDYGLSSERLTVLYAARGEIDQGPLVEAFLDSKGTTASEQIIATLTELDVQRCLLGAGLSTGNLAALRARLLEERTSVRSHRMTW